MATAKCPLPLVSVLIGVASGDGPGVESAVRAKRGAVAWGGKSTRARAARVKKPASDKRTYQALADPRLPLIRHRFKQSQA